MRFSFTWYLVVVASTIPGPTLVYVGSSGAGPLASPNLAISYCLSLVLIPALGAYWGWRFTGGAKDTQTRSRGLVPALFVGVFMPVAVVPPVLLGAFLAVAGIGEPKYLSSTAEILVGLVTLPLIISLIAYCAWNLGAIWLERRGGR